jgi:cytochrome P450 family 6
MLLQIALIFLCIYLWFKNRFEFFKRLGFPYVEGRIPFGSSSEINRTEHMCDFLIREYEKFKDQGPAFGIYLMARPMLIPTDPELIKDIFVRHFESFHDHGFMSNEKGDPLSANLFFKNGQAWRDLRAKLTPTFSSGKMKMMFPNVVRNCDRMIEHLKPYAESKEPLEVKEVFAAFTTEVIADVAFGLEINVLGNSNNEFRRYGKSVFEPTLWIKMKNFFVFTFEGLAKLLNMSFNTKEVTDFYTNTVRATLDYREQNNVKRNDFFQLLIDVKNSADGLPFKEMVANSFVFLLAG